MLVYFILILLVFNILLKLFVIDLQVLLLGQIYKVSFCNPAAVLCSLLAVKCLIIFPERVVALVIYRLCR
ncbi:hypothetical protein D3C85_1717900 [compost metagenome]